MNYKDDDYLPLLHEEKYLNVDLDNGGPRQRLRRWSRRLHTSLYLLLCGSLLLNVMQFTTSHPNPFFDYSVTPYAHLSWDTTTKFEYRGAWFHENATIRDEAWEALDVDTGSIALSDTYAESMSLPIAQRFPWDESKGLYFLSGYHSIHCLKTVRRTLQELFEGRTPSVGQHHTDHCLSALVQDVQCLADDTPLYSAADAPGKLGNGQRRVCRDWNKLEIFAKTHTSCWRDINPSEKIDTLLRYRYCPPGSPYLERIHKIFGDFETGPNASKDN